MKTCMSLALTLLLLALVHAAASGQAREDEVLYLPIIFNGSDVAGSLPEPTVPVLFIPGYAASSPQTGTIDSFALNRGADPATLNISPIYAMFERSLTSAGYVEGKTYFGAAYDWRMAAAPVDGDFDAYLADVTAASITSGSYDYAVNYVGYWLDQVVQTNPGVEYVDIVTHSTGGILARSYIQSAAYGATYEQDGETRTLPKVRYLIAGAAPFEGTIHSWRPWLGDFQDVLDGFIPTTEIEGRIAALTYELVRFGATVSGPDYDITRASIMETAADGTLQPNPAAFFRLYNPMRQRLMPTLDFLIPAGSTAPTNVNDDPEVRSDLLLDLNADSTAGDNPWAALVKTDSGEGGVIVTFAAGARERSGLADFIVAGLVDDNPYICTAVTITELDEDQGSYLPLPSLLEPSPAVQPVTEDEFERTGDTEEKQILVGDGNATYDSYLSSFAEDADIDVLMWGNGSVPTSPPDDNNPDCATPSTLPDDLTWTETKYPVYHDVFFYNPDVRNFVVSTMTGTSAPSVDVITTEELIALSMFLNGNGW